MSVSRPGLPIGSFGNQPLTISNAWPREVALSVRIRFSAYSFRFQAMKAFREV